MIVSTNETDQGTINRAIQQLEQGRLNVTGTCTLAGAIGKPMPGHVSLLMDIETMSAEGGPRRRHDQS
jgi:hypothetical protein